MMKTRAKTFWFIGIIVLLPLSAGAVSADIVISEIGAFEKSGEEWIELYNRSERSVSIEGWKFVEDFSAKNPKGVAHKLRAFQGDFMIEPYEYAIIAQDAILFLEKRPSFSGTIIDSSWSSLKQAGERLELKDKNGIVAESFAYPASSKTSLERAELNRGGDDISNWQSHPASHSAGAPNVFGISAPKAPQDARKNTVAKKEASPTLQDAQKEAQTTIDLHIEKQRGVALQPALPYAKSIAPKGPWDKIVYQALPRSLPARNERSPLLKKLGTFFAITLLLLIILRRKRGNSDV